MNVYMEPAEWWQIVVAFTTLAGFLVVAAAIVLQALRHRPPMVLPKRECSCQRADSWDRTAWALDMALDGGQDRRNLGLAVLEQLSASQFPNKLDAQIVAQARTMLNRL